MFHIRRKVFASFLDKENKGHHTILEKNITFRKTLVKVWAFKTNEVLILAVP